MAGSSDSFHEPVETLSAETLETHRGLVSLMEELEAVDWYSQRIDATQDQTLKSVLAHNRDEEKEHAMMTLEWLRRRDPALDEQMRIYLFGDGDILEAEQRYMTGAAEQASAPAAPASQGSLGIGSLKDTG